jgi:hypothetical protein
MATILTRPDARAHADDVDEDRPDPEVPERSQHRRFTAEYKLRILEEGDRTAEPGEVGRIVSAPQRWHCVGNGSFPPHCGWNNGCGIRRPMAVSVLRSLLLHGGILFRGTLADTSCLGKEGYLTPAVTPDTASRLLGPQRIGV